MTKATKQPTSKIVIGNVRSTIWANESEKGTFYSFTIERSYRTKDGEWKSTNSYSGVDLDSLKRCLELTEARLNTLNTKGPREDRDEE